MREDKRDPHHSSGSSSSVLGGKEERVELVFIENSVDSLGGSEPESVGSS